MARSFNGSSDYINLGSTAAAAVNRQEGTFFIRVRSTFPSAVEDFVDFRVNGDNEIEITDFHGNFGLNFRFAYISGGNYGNSVLGPSLSAGEHTIGATWSTSGNQIAAYIDGAQLGTDTANGTFSTATANNFYLGAGVGPSTYFVGDQSEFAYWSVPLTAAEIAALHAGYSPLMVRPGSLIDYYPIFGESSPEIGLKGNTATVNGTAKVAHPRVIQRRRTWTPYNEAAAATGRLFRPSTLSGLGAGGPFFQNPLG